MKFRIFMCVLILIFISSVSAQEEPEDSEELQTWFFEMPAYSIYVGEEFWVNITGEQNSTYDVRFVCLTNDTYSFHIDGRLDDNGTLDIPIAPFREKEKGYYIVELYHNGTLQMQEPLEVIFDINFSQDLRMDNIEDDIDWLKGYDSYIDSKIEELWNFYGKWLRVYFIIFAVSIGFNLLWLIILYPAMKFFYLGTTEDQNKKWWIWFLHFIQGGKTYDNMADEFPGFSLDVDKDKPFTKEDAEKYHEVTDDMVGLTQEEVEKKRREAVYKSDWKKDYPYGELSDQTIEWIGYKRIKPTKTNFLMILGSSLLTIMLFFIFNIFFLVTIILLWFVTFWYNRNLLAWFNAWNSKHKNKNAKTINEDDEGTGDGNE